MIQRVRPVDDCDECLTKPPDPIERREVSDAVEVLHRTQNALEGWKDDELFGKDDDQGSCEGK